MLTRLQTYLEIATLLKRIDRQHPSFEMLNQAAIVSFALLRDREKAAARLVLDAPAPDPRDRPLVEDL